MRVADRADNLKAFGGSGEKILGVFFGIDVFDEKLDVVFGGDVGTAFESFDAVGVHFRRGKPGNLISSLHNEASAFQFAHSGDEFAK